MSRAMNVDLPMLDVETLCQKHGSAISTIETLPSGCTRLVLRSGDAAAAMRQRLGKRVLSDYVERTAISPRPRSPTAAPSPPRG